MSKTREYLTEDSKWVSFYPELSAGFFIEKAGYFDERPCIHTSLSQLLLLVLLPFLTAYSLWFLLLFPLLFFGWGKLYINLPIRTGIQDCDSAAWGVNYHDNTLWIYIGGGGNFEGGKKWITYPMPWQRTWVKTSTLMSDGQWFNETRSHKVQWINDELGFVPGSRTWLDKNMWKETYPYLDKYDNTTVNATISVKAMEWRPLWLTWTSLFSKVRIDISVEFDSEVGERKGSWKGGATGCGYEMLPDETPLECLRRMENEREF